jgi:tRNA A-37 threonylcarbamoyl transferase component Bud32
MRFQLVARTGQPDFLDLPWDVPLEEWESERLVEVVRGLGRHVVRFVDYDGRLYALKQLPQRLANREYRLLRELEERSIPVVEAVGVVAASGLEEDEAVLITQHLEFSLPYRTLFTGRSVPDLRNRLLDALADLLVRLHLAGFFWGDCSLSNALFRRDAGALSAYLVDAETGELHPRLSDGQRGHDLDIAEENVAGELMDLQGASAGLPSEIDPVETAVEIRGRYESLWTELTHEDVFGPDERYRVEERLRRLNELGFDVEEVELVGEGGSLRLRVTPQVVEPGHHSRRLLTLTGLNVQENQARRLLNDLRSFRAYLEREEGRQLPESVVAYRWLTEVFEAAIQRVPADLRSKLEPAELFHEILENRWYLSETAGRDVGLEAAVASYVEKVLRLAPDERSVLLPDGAGSDEEL